MKRPTRSASKQPTPTRPRSSLNNDWGSPTPPMKSTPSPTSGPSFPYVGGVFDVASRAQENIHLLRQRILNNVLVWSLIFAAIAFTTTLGPRLATGQVGLVALFAILLLWMTIVTWRRNWPYRLRAYSFLLVIVFLGVSTMSADGLYGNGRIFLLALPVVASILLGATQAFVALGFVLLVMVIYGLGMVNSWIPAPVYTLSASVNESPTFWILAVATATLVGAATTVPLVVMFRGLQSTMHEQQRLRHELDEERLQLEERIDSRTEDLQRRLVQIRTAAEIARRLGAILDPQQLLQVVVDLMQERFELYYTGVFLLDDRKLNAVLRAGSGEAGQKMLARRHHLPLDGNSMIAWAVNNHQPRIALDVGKEAVRFENPDLPRTRSELALPLLAASAVGAGSNVCLGAMTIQSERATAFDEDDITVLQGIANSLATALQNASLFQQVQRNLEEIRTLNRQYLRQAWKGVSQAAGGALRAESVDELLFSSISPEPTQLSEPATEGSAGEGEAKEEQEQGPRTSFSAPLLIRDQTLGRLLVEFPSNRLLAGETQLDTGEQQLVEAVAMETALALENIRLLEETQRRASYERLLSEVTSAARGANDMEAILRSVVRQLGQALGADEALIRLEVEPVLNADEPNLPGEMSA